MDQFTPNGSPDGPLVVAVVYDGLCTFEFSLVAEIFGLPRPELGDHWYRFASAAVEPGRLRAHGGLHVMCDGGPDLLDRADLIVLPGWRGVDAAIPADLVTRLLAAHHRGARLASICSGAFVLAATGLLNGRRAATHWRYAQALASRYPAIEVDADVLYIADDRVFSSAGSAAGIDLMLHIVRSDFGVAAANSVARRLVMPPHRNGGQAQYIERLVPTGDNDRLAALLEKIRNAPQRLWTVDAMASEVGMSTRTLLRRFTETTGMSPGDWVTRVRIDEAKRLLEATRLTVEDVASRVGFASATTLRHHFRSHVGLSPRDYRQTFS